MRYSGARTAFRSRVPALWRLAAAGSLHPEPWPQRVGRKLLDDVPFSAFFCFCSPPALLSAGKTLVSAVVTPALRGPAGDISVRLRLGLSALILINIFFPIHLRPACPLCSSQRFCGTSGDCWGADGAGRLCILRFPLSPFPGLPNLSAAFLGLESSSLTSPAPSALLSCLMSSSLPVVMAACCYGGQLPQHPQSVSHT